MSEDRTYWIQNESDADIHLIPGDRRGGVKKFRKKPVVIEATQYNANSKLNPGVCWCGTPQDPHIHTLEGAMTVSHGDWIITGIKGERYPCKPDIFEATYEPVEDQA